MTDRVRSLPGRAGSLAGRLVRRERLRGVRDRLGRGGLLAAGTAGVVLLVVLLVIVIGGGAPAPEPVPEAADEAAAAREAGASPAVARLMRRMSTAEKVGQLMLVGPNGTDTEGAVFAAIGDHGYGGIVIESRDYESPDQVSDVAAEAASVARKDDRIAPWLMAPQPGGQFSALADLPPEQAPGKIGSPRDAADAAEESAKELLDARVNGVLAPALDVAPFGGGELGDLAYSDDETEVSKYAAATVKAYRKEDIFAAAGRFPGLGGASQDTEEGPVNVGLGVAELMERDLRPFEAAIKADVPGILIGPGIYQAGDFVTPASLSPTIATKLLRDRLGFKGVAIADDLTSPAVSATVPPADAAVEAIKAGVDLVYVSRDADVQEAVYDALLKAVEKETIEQARLDEAVARTLAAKQEAGLLEGDDGNGGADGGGEERAGSPVRDTGGPSARR